MGTVAILTLVGEFENLWEVVAYLLHLHIVELDGRPDELALMVLQTALALGLLHHGQKLLLRDALVLHGMAETDHQLVEQPEEEVQGRHKDQADLHAACRLHTVFLRLVLGQGLGGDLSEDQDDDRQDDGGDQRTVDFEEAGEEDGAQGGRRQVHDVVGDEDAGEELVILLQQFQGLLGLGIPVIGLVFQPDLVHRGKSGLRGGTPGGEGHQDEQDQDDDYTACVHKGRIISAF